MKGFGFLKGVALGAATSTVMLGAGAALAGSGIGGIFNLGEQNSVNAKTELEGSTDQPLLKVQNTNAGNNAVALDVRKPAATGAGPAARAFTFAGDAGATGVLGRASATTAGSNSSGVHGENLGTNDRGFGVWGGHSGSGTGVFGRSVHGVGVRGIGGLGEPAVLGEGTIGGRFTGIGPGAVGVEASGPKTGVEGASPAIGVRGCAGGLTCGAGPSVLGPVAGHFQATTTAGTAIIACKEICAATLPAPAALIHNTDGTGAQISSSGGPAGVVASVGAAGGTGVLGLAGADGTGVTGRANSGGAGAVGVLGQSASGLAGKFEGTVHVTGGLTKAFTAGTASRAIPLGYAVVSGLGSVLKGTPNVSSTFDSVNDRYEITFAGESYNLGDYATTVTPVDGSTPRFASTQASSGKLLVTLRKLDGTKTTGTFTLVTYKP